MPSDWSWPLERRLQCTGRTADVYKNTCIWSALISAPPHVIYSKDHAIAFLPRSVHRAAHRNCLRIRRTLSMPSIFHSNYSHHHCTRTNTHVHHLSLKPAIPHDVRVTSHASTGRVKPSSLKLSTPRFHNSRASHSSPTAPIQPTHHVSPHPPPHRLPQPRPRLLHHMEPLQRPRHPLPPRRRRI